MSGEMQRITRRTDCLSAEKGGIIPAVKMISAAKAKLCFRGFLELDPAWKV
jgi:hypothetical protein